MKKIGNLKPNRKIGLFIIFARKTCTALLVLWLKYIKKIRPCNISRNTRP